MLKRGMSDIVSNVLIILIVVVSVAIIGTIVIKSTNNLSESLETSITPVSLFVPVQSVFIASDGTSKYVYLNIQRTTGEGDLTGLNLIFYDLSGQTYTQTINQTLNVFESKSVMIKLPSTIVTIDKIEAYPIVKTTKGKNFVGKTGAVYNYNFPNIATSPILLADGSKIVEKNGQNFFVNCSSGPDVPIVSASGNLGAITLSWTASECMIIRYQVYRSNSPGGIFNKIAEISNTITSYVDNTAGQQIRYYKVSSLGNAGEFFSEIVSASGCSQAPAIFPTGIVASATTSKSISLTWNANVACASGYKISRNGAVIANPQTSPYLDTGLNPQTTYVYTISSSNSFGDSAQSAAYSQTTFNREGGIGSANLVAEYKFDEASWSGSLGEVKDNTASLFHGTAYGARITSDSKLGNAGEFDGINDYVETKDFSFGNTKSFTFSIWAKTPAFLPNRAIFGKPSPGWEYTFATVATNTARFVYWNTSGIGEVDLNPSSNIFPNNGWTHFVITYNSSGTKTARLYVNGADRSTDSLVSANFADKRNNLYIGGGYYGGSQTYFNGKIDEIRIYNKTLAANEILNLFNSYS